MKLPAHPGRGVSAGRSSLRAMDVVEQAAIALEEVCGALPPMARTADPDEVVSFLEGL